MTKKLPEFDDLGRSISTGPGMYRRDRMVGKTLDELKAFIEAATELHGGGSILSVCDEYDGYPGYISLELEADIDAEREEAEAAAARNKTRLEAWNALTPKQRKELGPITMHDGPGPLVSDD